jgi:ABC-type Mn2+/Zn2+ transport system ATPase subunit
MVNKNLCAMIQLQNITLQTKNNRILDNISYTCKTGTATVIIGHNGSGKTSLIKTIIGQIKPTNGMIQYH